jgi:predicted ATPase
MRLTKLYIHNYKSFYDTTIELDKMNIVVGENNSGKSNLIDVLEFIQLAKNKNFYKAISIKGGFDKILNYNYDERNIIFQLKLEDNDFLVKARFTVNQKISVVSVIIYAKLEDKILPLHINASRHNRKLDIMKDKIYSYEENILELKLVEKLFFLQLEFPVMISSIATTYVFNTETIRAESHKESIKELSKDGSNLGKNLFNIKNNYPNTFELISNSMIGIVNEIDGVDVQETFGNYLIGFHEQNKQIGMDMVSDGTINLFATITALNQEDDKSLLLAFDEPERYLHLKAVNYLLESFRASEKQILITTHSTEILKYANLDEIVFIYRNADGDTQSIRANKIEGLKDMLKELAYERDLTLDELIADGVIGDFK